MRVRGMLVATAVTVLGYAQIPSGGVYVPASGGDMPFYFSGTYCRASGYVGVLAPPPGFTDPLFITWAELSINGTIVEEYVKLPEDPGMFDVTLGEIFDSTHFANGTTITVRMTGEDSAGRLYDDYDTSVVKNSALAWNYPFDYDVSGYYWDDNGALLADADFESANITSDYNYGRWTPQEFFNAMFGVSCVYVATHGGPSPSHEAGDAQSIKPCGYTHPKYGWIPGYEEERMAAIGTGLPPFNSTSLPPLTFLIIHSCDSGITNDFVRGLYPYENHYVDWLIDQILWGSLNHLAIDQIEDMTDVYMGMLAEGWTALYTRTWLYTFAEEYGFIAKDHGVPGSVWRTLQEGDIGLYGDEASRLRTPYTGNNVAPLGVWHY